MSETTKHGWYSAKQAEMSGEVEYSTPDGGLKHCTDVTDTEDRGRNIWDDLVYVGPVVEFQRRVSYGQLPAPAPDWGTK